MSQITVTDKAEWNPVPKDIRENEFMILAWRDCLVWASAFPDILNAFKEATGKALDVSSRGLAEAIDQATGYRDAEYRRFIEWFNENVWGAVEETVCEGVRQ